jgi:hypothetical protein
MNSNGAILLFIRLTPVQAELKSSRRPSRPCYFNRTMTSHYSIFFSVENVDFWFALRSNAFTSRVTPCHVLWTRMVHGTVCLSVFHGLLSQMGPLHATCSWLVCIAISLPCVMAWASTTRKAHDLDSLYCVRVRNDQFLCILKAWHLWNLWP